MTDATFIKGHSFWAKTADQTKSVSRPKPKPMRAPVFINDCVTPLAGETLLSLLMKRMQDDDQA